MIKTDVVHAASAACALDLKAMAQGKSVHDVIMYRVTGEAVFPVISADGSITTRVAMFPMLPTEWGYIVLGVYEQPSLKHWRPNFASMREARQKLLDAMAAGKVYRVAVMSPFGAKMPTDGELVHLVRPA